ncbi:hypothetical protein WJ41_18510 [Burkholderia ubonensis]|uniref:hypothetical protein n=1 Tax=Burkholderia ubonensis TaxID=101571 RepID=UPI00075B2FFA|nr:hypothetical protein [Burkholderia ubonensis]KVH69830.1 hypothetical protein WJ41_18510 [Burkholderia ubonensis]KVL69829.1 hypothetical protein WJ48_10235 [Burkholderia ubonensis]KVL70002.1 hypothetical protein WJ49_24150 [Burkholderia ubonensis]KVL85181.1 hypothetical protein WJ50_20615 [Burkholderia ubonensis]KVU06886.1 hypothetical protein WK61_31060 [Burkholderia ubonensis]
MNNGERISAFLAISERFLCGAARAHDDTPRRRQPTPAPTRDTIASRVVRTGGSAGHAAGQVAGRYATVPVCDARQERAMGSCNGEER